MNLLGKGPDAGRNLQKKYINGETNRERVSTMVRFDFQVAIAVPRFPVGVCCSVARQSQESRRQCVFTPTYVHMHARTRKEAGREAFFHGYLQFK